MKILDFATSDVRSAMKIVNAFARTDQYRVRRILEAMPTGPKSVAEVLTQQRPAAKLDGDVVEFFPRKGVVLRAWMQGSYYLMSFNLTGAKDPTWDALQAMVGIMRAMDRRDLPVKIDKKDTITIKAAIAITALIIAQGVEDCSSILWDMARDKEI